MTTHYRPLMKTQWHVVVMALVSLIHGRTAFGDAGSLQAPLTIDHAVTRSLATSEDLAFPLELSGAGDYLITVEQWDSDVTLTLIDNTSDSRVVVNRPLPFHRIDNAVFRATHDSDITLLIGVTDTIANSRIRIGISRLADSPPSGFSGYLLLMNADSRAIARSLTERKSAVAIYRAALPLLKRSHDATAVARTHASLAATLLRLGEEEASLRHFDEALAGHASESGRLPAVLTDRGYAHFELGNLNEALADFEQALSAAKATKNERLQALNMNNVGLVSLELGEFSYALQRFEEVDALYTQRKDQLGRAMAQNNIASAYKYLGNVDGAIKSFRAALSIHDALPSRDQMETQKNRAALQLNLATVHQDIGDISKALESFNEADQFWSRLANKRETGRARQWLGEAYQLAGNRDRARAYFEQAIQLRRDANDYRGAALSMLDLARLSLEQGDTVSTQRLINEALATLDTSSDAGDRDVLFRSQVNLLQAELASKKGDQLSALSILAQTESLASDVNLGQLEVRLLDLRGRALLRQGSAEEAAAAFKSGIETASSMQMLQQEADAHLGLATACDELGRTDMAIEETTSAIGALERLRSLLAHPALRRDYLQTQRSAYELKVDLLMRESQRHTATSHATALAVDALFTAESARARALMDFLAASTTDIYASTTPSERESLANYRRKLRLLSAELSRTNPKRASKVGQLAAGLETTRAELEQLEAQVFSRMEQAAVNPLQQDSLDRIQNELSDDRVIVEFALGDKQSFAWVVSSKGLKAHVLPGRQMIESLVREYYRMLRSRHANDAQKQRQVGQELSDILLNSIYPDIAGARLAIVPDGELHYLPFSALPPPATANLDRGPLLLHHEISVIPSIATLVALRKRQATRQTPSKTVAVVADPVFDANDERVAETTTIAAAQEVALTRSDLRRLVQSRDEAKAIADLLAREDVTLAFDFDASRQNLLAGLASDHWIVHLATHGHFDRHDPLQSGLVLSQVNAAGQAINGLIAMDDIFGLPISARLVVLSACETGLGKAVRGEGLVGLAQGFLYAGVPSVVSSLWLVQDKGTSQLMASFYENMLKNGASPAAALRAAKLELWEMENKDPYFWSAFVLHGDWRPVPILK